MSEIISRRQGLISWPHFDKGQNFFKKYPPPEVDIIKVTKVFTECMHTQVEEVLIDVEKFICKNTAQTEEVECLSATANIIDLEILDDDVVRIIFELEVCVRILLDNGEPERVCKTIEVAKVLRIAGASEEGMDVQGQVFPECLFCFISQREKCRCIFDNFMADAYQNLPDTEIKQAYLNLYDRYSPLLSLVIKSRPELSLKAYKLLNKYTPAIQYSIDNNFGHKIQIAEGDIAKITAFLEEIKNELRQGELDSTLKSNEFMMLINQFMNDLDANDHQDLGEILAKCLDSVCPNEENGKNNFSDITCLKPVGVKEVTCCVGILILLKVEAEVQLLVPAYGYPGAPPECEEFLGECPADFTPAWPPYPPQTGFGRAGNNGGSQ
ncbi:MAG: hypothetical protein ACOWWO_05125 [Peptococcaceae bacterium]